MYLDYFKHQKINNYGDRILLKKTNFPFYLMNVKNKNSVWHKIQNKLENLCDNDDVVVEDIENFLNKNPHIEFEIEFFVNEMPEIFFFKIKNIIYCYTCDSTILHKIYKKKVKARFYFDYREILEFNS
jgi:hypothetical protein